MKKTFAVVVCIVLLLSCISINAIDTSKVYLVNQINSYTYSNAVLEGNFVGYFRLNSATDTTHPLYVASNYDDVYISFYNQIDSNSNYPYLRTVFMSSSPNRTAYYAYMDNNNSVTLNLTTQYNDEILYYAVIGGQPYMSLTDGYSFCEDLQDCLNSFLETSHDNSREMTINLPAGNVAYIELDNTYNQASFAVTMPTASYAIGSSPWPESNQQYFFTSMLPSVGNFAPQGTKINWLRNGKTTLAGITTQASASISGSSSSTYLCVVNPAYYGGTANGPYEFLMNGTVSITVNGFVRVKIFQLESTLGLPADPTDHSQLVVNTSITGTDYEGEVDEDTGNIIWTNNEEPVIGGGNLVTPSVNGFQSWLQGILDSIVNIFEPAHNAIQTLASAVSNFAGWLYALYIWLPSPVLSVLTSAITLAIIIGVVKVFI